MYDMELEIKLKEIQEAVEKAKGDPKKEKEYLAAITDPQDKNACDGCQ